ncbi:MAG: hypothetical protein WAS21_16695 [Geminicoccaceae bacterium]
MRIDTAGNSTAEMEIELAGIVNLAGGDFLLQRRNGCSANRPNGHPRDQGDTSWH